MKRLFYVSWVIGIALIFFFSASCTQKAGEEEEVVPIENTLKSVSLFQDTTGIDPLRILASLERVNQAIDSIGYPDAGYELWIVQSDTVVDFRFMVNGFWPDQDAYDEIHNNELYVNAWEGDEDFWVLMKSTFYNRFTRVK